MTPIPPERHSELLERRPEARAFKVEDLLTEVRLGRVRIPAFQRGLKWKRDDARQLIDSIYRGYPIGTLLLWETSADAGEVKFGSITVHAGARTDALWVVDGQQRIDSLVRILMTRHPSPDSFALYFDLDEATLVYEQPPKLTDGDGGRWMPLAVAMNAEHLIHWLLDNVSTAERREKAIQLGKRIREFDIPAYVVKTASEATLRQIFGRTNNAGKRLEAAEVFDALHGARSASRPATLSDIVEELRTLDFGRVEQKILYRLLRVLAGADVSERSGGGALRLSDIAASEAYAQTAAVAKDVIQFLKRDVGIAHYKLLPYKQPMVTLGKFFSRHPSPSPRSRELLVRWLWRGALNGAHRGDTVSTRRSLSQIDDHDEERSVQNMLALVSDRPAELPSVHEPFNFRHASSKLQTLALIGLRPRDLEDGVELDVARLFDDRRDDSELPVPSIITSIAGQRDGVLLSVANRIVHPIRPGLRRLIESTDDEFALESQGIAMPSRKALASGDFHQFLQFRSESLSLYFQRFFEQHARWSESDRPSIQSLAVAEED